jgi:hypothetical protein
MFSDEAGFTGDRSDSYRCPPASGASPELGIDFEFSFNREDI